MFTTEVLDGPVTTNKKAHDIIVGASPFLRSDSKLSRFRLSKEKRKRFMSICYNFSFSFWCSLEFGEKFGLYFRVRRYENYWVVIILWKNLVSRIL